MQSADVARARRVVEAYDQAVMLSAKGNWRVGRCPFHDDHSPSFGVRDGRWICFSGCGKGDVIDFVMRLRGLRFDAAVAELLGGPLSGNREGYKSPPPPVHRAPAPSAGTADAVQKIIAGCTPVQERTPARLYLSSRGLNLNQPALLAHPALWCEETHTRFPALVAPLTQSSGEVTAVQRIWCLPVIVYGGGDVPKDGRAPLKVRKKTLGAMGDGAVRLQPAGPILGLCEGVESAIAAAMLYHVPVWAVCGAARLARAWVPDDVRQVVIFADNGEVGERLAAAAVEAHQAADREAWAVFPEPRYGDFNDQLIG